MYENYSHEYFRIDWFDFKRKLRETILDGIRNPFGLKNPSNIAKFQELATGSGSWQGFTDGQLRRWITEGYVPPKKFDRMGDLIPPMQERRRVYMTDEGDNFHVDAAIGGEDYFMSSVTKKEIIPGMKVEAQIMFSGATSADIVNTYIVWICKILYSLETSGVSTQLYLDFPSVHACQTANASRTVFHHLVRVKRENEISDFKSWSAMISPAAMRNFGFSLIPVHADKLGVKWEYGLGRGMRQNDDFTVNWNPKRRAMEIASHYHGARTFNEDRMTADFRKQLQRMRSGK